MTWAISVPILVFLGLPVLDIGPMYATDRRQTSDRRQTKASLNAPPIRGAGIIIRLASLIRGNYCRHSLSHGRICYLYSM